MNLLERETVQGLRKGRRLRKLPEEDSAVWQGLSRSESCEELWQPEVLYLQDPRSSMANRC